jgi:large subunit ribosomal protein L1
MRSRGKKYTAARQQVPARPHKIEEAVPLIQKVKYTKFDETVEMAVRLGVDPKHSDQMVRGTVVLPHGLGKSKKVLVIANADKQREAREAGADEIGGDDVVDRILGGWTDFDAVVATPDMMRSVGKLGKVLGPKGLMPIPRRAPSRRTWRRPCRKSRRARWSSASTKPASSTRRSARFHSRRIV